MLMFVVFFFFCISCFYRCFCVFIVVLLFLAYKYQSFVLNKKVQWMKWIHSFSKHFQLQQVSCSRFVLMCLRYLESIHNPKRKRRIGEIKTQKEKKRKEKKKKSQNNQMERQKFFWFLKIDQCKVVLNWNLNKNKNHLVRNLHVWKILKKSRKSQTVFGKNQKLKNSKCDSKTR